MNQLETLRGRVPVPSAVLGAAVGVILVLAVVHSPAAAGLAAVAIALNTLVVVRLLRDPSALPAELQRVREFLVVELRLLGLLRPHIRTVMGGLGITLGITLVGLAKPWPTKVLVDDVLGGGSLLGLSPRAALAVAVASTILLFIASGLLGLLQIRVLFDLTQRLIADLRGQTFDHLARLSLRFHDARGIGDSAYRLSADTYALHNVVLGGVVPLASAVLTLIGIFAVMAALDLSLALLSIACVPAAAVVTRRFGQRIRNASQVVRERESDVYTQAEQTLAGIRAVQAFAREPYETARFTERAESSRGAMIRLVTEQTLFGLAVDAVLGLGIAAVTWVAATRALDGQLTIGEVLVFLAYAGTLYAPVSELAGVFGEMQEAAASAQRVFDVLDEPRPPEPVGAVPPAIRATGRLSFHGVGFGYDHDHPVLHELNLVIEPGATVAVVGPTGAGKSTVLSLLLRLYDPDDGSVRLDGHDLRSLPTDWLRHQIALVPQDPMLFGASVRDNIRYGRLDATDAEIEEAARQANILEELLDDPRGLDAPIGDRGVTLSGGQRQRVAIARAFLRDAAVIILDEPTSALDAGTEALVMEALWRLRQGRTCVVIAHRLSSVEGADEVVVMDGGRVVQQGTHEQLVAHPGLYRRLHAKRFESGGTTRGHVQQSTQIMQVPPSPAANLVR
ncbi:ABC transporter transmembrane domain-containing protein [soil metagenome]